MMENKETPKAESIDENVVNTTDENAAETSPLTEQEQENIKLKAEIEEQKDKYLRLMAEFDNYRRRTSKERLELIQTAGKDVIVSMLEVLDDIDRAEKQMATASDFDIQKEGIQLVFNKVRSTMQSKGVKPLESINTDFDVEKHEAITEIPAPNDSLKGKVLDEVQKGYFLNDKLIRFAKVVVGN
jgi:molecular chaperone GrpE